jgi:DNA polymerase III delta prime subunit
MKIYETYQKEFSDFEMDWAAIQEVLNYKNALHRINQRKETQDILNPNEILKLHSILMENLLPSQKIGNYRPGDVYIIDEVHMLSKGAFNALLKTIEEPRDNVCFILATTELQKVPETIISRCQVFNFKKVDKKEIETRLKMICKKEELQATDEAIQLIAKISE